MKDAQGHWLTVQNADAAVKYNQAVNELLDYKLTAMPTLKEAIALEPDFCMAHCLRGYMLMMMNSSKMHPPAMAELDLAARASTGATERERLHVEALRSWTLGDLPRATARWEAIVARYPQDILSLRLHHFISFWMGRSQQLIALPASAYSAWDKTVPHYGNLLGMMCFGLEETGHYEKAEVFGREAVALNPNDLWAIHSVAHVLEMQKRHAEGLAWLDYPRAAWDDRNPFRGHLWWHKGLYLLEERRFDEALRLYDDAIYDTTSTYFLDLQNAAALLARLEFLGVNVADRWDVLADHACAAKGDHELVFTDLHNVLSLARTGRLSEARDFVASMQRCVDSRHTHSSQVLKRVGIPMSEGIIAFYEGRYDDALEIWALHKPILAEVGASNAQRDLFGLFAIEAARRGGQRQVLQHLNWERDFMTRLAQLKAA